MGGSWRCRLRHRRLPVPAAGTACRHTGDKETVPLDAGDSGARHPADPDLCLCRDLRRFHRPLRPGRDFQGRQPSPRGRPGHGWQSRSSSRHRPDRPRYSLAPDLWRPEHCRHRLCDDAPRLFHRHQPGLPCRHHRRRARPGPFPYRRYADVDPAADLRAAADDHRHRMVRLGKGMVTCS
ncbi:MAG: hypothetical protein CM15mP115_05900 [Alphaproteobacteria bacterium]|nr:MAG: hypothetical protein CM15mP115_05900 [Alphaproteobacteria bacterium]